MRKLSGLCKSIFDGIDKALRFLGGLFILMIAAIILLGIVSRAIGRPIPRLEEITPDLFVWMTALGMAEAVRSRGHLSTDILVERMPLRGRKMARAATTALSAGFLLAIAISGVNATRAAVERQEMTAVGYPAWLVVAALPAGAILAFLACISLTCAEPEKTSIPNPGKEDSTMTGGQ
jgi:TRAP-type C4-dicarboxylate transport system permease small subunit